MKISYVQYLNIGFGIINNTREIDSWNTNECIEEALLLDNEKNDVRIIGFRFYDIDSDTKVILKQGGINYLQGELFTYPKIDNDMMILLKATNMDYLRDQKLIKLKKPYTIVYPFNEDDCILDITPFQTGIKIKRIKEEIEKTNLAIETYKRELVSAIRNIADSIETNSYNKIPFYQSPINMNEKQLNILDDQGNFVKHIDYLRNERLRIIDMEKHLNELTNPPEDY